MMQTCTATGWRYGTDVCTDDSGGYCSADDSIDEFAYSTLGQYNDGTSNDASGCSSPTSEHFPSTPMCFRGCCSSGVSCSSSIASCPSSGTLDGVTSDYADSVPTVNDLSVAGGLPLNTAACDHDDIACGSCSECGWRSAQARARAWA
ncbi:unnamed protein product [Prorocentrum cordatum]|uniref:Subtilisin n=1 Tax=Prorocentrum cordatum TaxID=2364126 RepID=A0ABN9U7B1_9DINO|nr:unnamed protein product [Polarella glacialis]